MIAIAVDTPSQLIAALLAYQRVGRGQPIVLFGRHGLETKGRHPSIVRMLYYGDEQHTPSRLLSGLMSPSTLLRTIPGFDSSLDIDTLITSRSAFVSTYLQKEYAARHPFLPVYLVESGPGEYYEQKPRDRFVSMCAMMKQPTHMDFVSRAFLAAPSLYPFDRPYPVEPLPRADLETRQVLGPMLGRPPREERARLQSRPFLFFESDVRTGADAGQEFDVVAADSRVLSAAVRAVGAQRITVITNGKRDIPYERDLQILTLSLPLESFLYRGDFNWQILIADSLGPLTAPKLFFDQEPFLVFTGLIDGSENREREETFFREFSALYSRPRKCVMPRSLLELKDVLQDFLGLVERGQAQV